MDEEGIKALMRIAFAWGIAMASNSPEFDLGMIAISACLITLGTFGWMKF